MLHLLSESQKNKVIKEYRMRLFVVISIAVFFISISGIALLIPTYISSVGSVSQIKNANKLKENVVAILGEKKFDERIKSVDYGIKALSSSINIYGEMEVYNKIIESLPEGIIINRYTYGLVDSDNASISIDGYASDRDKLMVFQNKLKQNKEFTGINIPISSFTKKKDLVFSLKFNLIKMNTK